MISLSQRTKYSDKLLYDQYRWCIRLAIPHVEAVRSLDHKRIDDLLNLWGTMEIWTRKVNPGGNWNSKRPNVTEEHFSKLHDLCDIIDSHGDDIKVNFTQNKCFIYTNDRDVILADLNEKMIVAEALVTEVILDRNEGSVKSRYPGFEVRAYLRPRMLTGTEKRNLIKFIDQNAWHVRLNVGLERFVNNSSLRMRDYFFIDFQDHRLAGILELMVPGAIRKTMDIIYEDK